MSEQFSTETKLISRGLVPRVALLVDGENLSQEFAGQIIREAMTEGEIVIRRVYGDAGRLPKWNCAPGFRMVHSGSGKNATDLLLTVEAMALMLNGQADVLCIAASDVDYTHLATHLREAGIKVVGLGEKKATERLRKSFSRFRELVNPVQPIVTEPVVSCDRDPTDKLVGQIISLIRDEGVSDGFSIVKLGGRMHALHKTKISTLPDKTWRVFLCARGNIFDCDAKGPEAKVRVKT